MDKARREPYMDTARITFEEDNVAGEEHPKAPSRPCCGHIFTAVGDCAVFPAASVGGDNEKVHFSKLTMDATGFAEVPVDSNCRWPCFPFKSKHSMAAQVVAAASTHGVTARGKLSLLQRLKGSAVKALSQENAVLSEEIRELWAENMLLTGRVDLAEQALAEAQHVQAEKQMDASAGMAVQAAEATAEAAQSNIVMAAQLLAAQQATASLMERSFELAASKEEVRSLRSVVVGLEFDRGNRMLSQKALESKVEELNGSLNAVCVERNLLQLELAASTDELGQAHSRATACEEMCNATTAQLASDREASAEKVAAMELDLATARATNEALHAELAGKHSQLMNVMQEKEAATTDAAALREKLAALSSELTDTCQALESKLASQRAAESAELEVKVNILQATQAYELAASRKAFDEKVAALNLQLSSERASCEALQAELHAKDAALAAITTEKNSAATDAACLRGRMAAMTSQLSDACQVYEKALASERAASAALQAMYDSMVSKLQSTHAQEMDSSRKALEGKVATLESRLASLTVANAVIKSKQQKEVLSWQQAHQALRVEVSASNEQLAARNEELNSVREALEGKVATLEQEVAKLTTDKADIKSRLAEQLKQVLSWRHANNVLQAELKTRNDQLEACTKALDLRNEELAGVWEDLGRQIQDLRGASQSANSMLTTCQQQLAAEQAQRMALEQRFSLVSTDLATLKHEAQDAAVRSRQDINSLHARCGEAELMLRKANADVVFLHRVLVQLSKLSRAGTTTHQIQQSCVDWQAQAQQCSQFGCNVLGIAQRIAAAQLDLLSQCGVAECDLQRERALKTELISYGQHLVTLGCKAAFKGLVELLPKEQE